MGVKGEGEKEGESSEYECHEREAEVARANRKERDGALELVSRHLDGVVVLGPVITVHPLARACGTAGGAAMR